MNVTAETDLKGTWYEYKDTQSHSGSNCFRMGLCMEHYTHLLEIIMGQDLRTQVTQVQAFCAIVYFG